MWYDLICVRSAIKPQPTKLPTPNQWWCMPLHIVRKWYAVYCTFLNVVKSAVKSKPTDHFWTWSCDWISCHCRRSLIVILKLYSFVVEIVIAFRFLWICHSLLYTQCSTCIINSLLCLHHFFFELVFTGGDLGHSQASACGYQWGLLSGLTGNRRQKLGCALCLFLPTFSSEACCQA